MPYDPLVPADLVAALRAPTPERYEWARLHVEARGDAAAMAALFDAWAVLPEAELPVPLGGYVADQVDRLVAAVDATRTDVRLRVVLYHVSQRPTPDGLALARRTIASVSPAPEDEIARVCVAHATSALVAHGDADDRALLRERLSPRVLAGAALRQGQGHFLGEVAQVLHGLDAVEMLVDGCVVDELPEELPDWRAVFRADLPGGLATALEAKWHEGGPAFARFARDMTTPPPSVSEAVHRHWDSYEGLGDARRALWMVLAACAASGLPTAPETASLLAWLVTQAWRGAVALEWTEREVRSLVADRAGAGAQLSLRMRRAATSSEASYAASGLLAMQHADLAARELAVVHVVAQTAPSLFSAVMPTLVARLEAGDADFDDLARDLLAGLGDASLTWLGDPRRHIHPGVLADVLLRIGTPAAYRTFVEAVPPSPTAQWRDLLVIVARWADAAWVHKAMAAWSAADRRDVLARIAAIHGAPLPEGGPDEVATSRGERLAEARKAAKRARRKRRGR
jgi:hypothetical protein